MNSEEMALRQSTAINGTLAALDEPASNRGYALALVRKCLRTYAEQVRNIFACILMLPQWRTGEEKEEPAPSWYPDADTPDVAESAPRRSHELDALDATAKKVGAICSDWLFHAPSVELTSTAGPDVEDPRQCVDFLLGLCAPLRQRLSEFEYYMSDCIDGDLAPNHAAYDVYWVPGASGAKRPLPMVAWVTPGDEWEAGLQLCRVALTTGGCRGCEAVGADGRSRG